MCLGWQSKNDNSSWPGSKPSGKSKWVSWLELPPGPTSFLVHFLQYVSKKFRRCRGWHQILKSLATVFFCQTFLITFIGTHSNVNEEERSWNQLPYWKTSEAKEILIQDRMNGKTARKMSKQVFQMHPELYQLYGLTRFWLNYNSLKVAIKKNQEKADSDSATLAHDHQLHPPPATHTSTLHSCYPWWDGSAVQWLLKQDVDSGLAENLKPQLLHAYWPEYIVFPLEVFQDHIH